MNRQKIEVDGFEIQLASESYCGAAPIIGSLQRAPAGIASGSGATLRDPPYYAYAA
jgi:hypothetical protein